MRRTVAVAVLAVALVGPGAAGTRAPAIAGGQARNVIVVMTDDQSIETMAAMPKTKALIGGRGVTFEQAVVSFPLCCPSRATLLTGRFAHNHGVFANRAPAGYEAFRDTPATLPETLQARGYRTIHVGKYLNNYGLADPTEVPRGWSRWRGLVDPSTYWMHGFTLNSDGRLRVVGDPQIADPRTYQTDVLARIATTEITRAARAGKPFYLELMTLAPHGELPYPGQTEAVDPRAAPRHEGLFRGVRAPRTAAFDEVDVSDKGSLVKRRGRFGPGTLRRIDLLYANRREALLSVDDAVASIVETLEAEGIVDDTVIVFTSDNGFMQGEHRFQYGKFVPYEPSIRVPLLIAGPGVAVGVRSPQLVSNVDLAPTILGLLGISTATGPFDGHDLSGHLADPSTALPRTVLLETYPFGATDQELSELEAMLLLEDPDVVSYAGIRTDRYLYVEMTDGTVELYDLVNDPDQLESIASDPSVSSIRATLSNLLVMLRTCSGVTCREIESLGVSLLGAAAR